MDNVKQPIKMQISNKQKIFSLFYSRFLKSKTNFEHFEKKITLTPYLFPKLQTAKDLVRQMLKKSCLRRTFDKQDGKRVQPLLRSSRQHVYHDY